MSKDLWKLGSLRIRSRVLHCFGEPNNSISKDSIASSLIIESGTEFITLYTHGDMEKFSSIDDFPIGYEGITFADIKKTVNTENYIILINTNHSTTVEDAIKRAEVGRKLTGSNLIKLEVLSDDKTLPINSKVIDASSQLISKGYQVMPLINKGDVAAAKKLEKLGCLCVRVLLNPIGSKKGLTNEDEFSNIVKNVSIPVIAEGGIRDSTDAYKAMALGADAVLVNKAIFSYKDPIEFIIGFKTSVEAGRMEHCNKLQMI